MLGRGNAGSYGSSIFNCLKNLLTVFHSVSTHLHSLQQGTGLVFSPHSHQYLLFLAFMIIAVNWYLIVDLIWISLMIIAVKHFFIYLLAIWASLVAQLVRNPPAMRETWLRSLGWEDPMEKGKATHSSVLTWRISWTIWSMGSQGVRHDWATFTHFTLSHFTQN